MSPAILDSLVLSNGLVLSSDLACLARNLFHFVLISIITKQRKNKIKEQKSVKTFDPTPHPPTAPPLTRQFMKDVRVPQSPDRQQNKPSVRETNGKQHPNKTQMMNVFLLGGDTIVAVAIGDRGGVYPHVANHGLGLDVGQGLRVQLRVRGPVRRQKRVLGSRVLLHRTKSLRVVAVLHVAHTQPGQQVGTPTGGLEGLLVVGGGLRVAGTTGTGTIGVGEGRVQRGPHHAVGGHATMVRKGSLVIAPVCVCFQQIIHV